MKAIHLLPTLLLALSLAGCATGPSLGASGAKTN